MLALRDAGFAGPPAHHLVNFRIETRTPVLVVLVPARSRFLAVAPKFAEAVLRERLPHPGLFKVPVLFTDTPAHVKTCQIARSHGSHRHAEVEQRLVHGVDTGAFLHQKLRLTAIGAEHAVSHKAPAVADEHPDFSTSRR